MANTPFRQHKNTNYEGGIASPLVVWWPGVIKATGSVTNELSHITDIPATCYETAGITYPEGFGDRRVTPLAGRFLLPAFKGNQRDGHRMLGWATSGSRAVRVGSWKLVSLPNKPWELCDLSTDRTEMNDRAGEQPQRVTEMAEIFAEWHAK